MQSSSNVTAKPADKEGIANDVTFRIAKKTNPSEDATKKYATEPKKEESKKDMSGTKSPQRETAKEDKKQVNKVEPHPAKKEEVKIWTAEEVQKEKVLFSSMTLIRLDIVISYLSHC